MVEPVRYRLEENRGSGRKPRWVWLASFPRMHDAEQAMFRLMCGDAGKRAQRVISDDGHRQSYVPFGPMAKGEF